MTDKELREKAEEAVRANEFPGDATLGELGLLVEYEQWCVPRVATALEAAYREGVEAMRDKWIEEEGDRFAPQRAADWLLEGATPNETTREAIDEAERGEAATYNDAQTLFAHLGLDEEEKP